MKKEQMSPLRMMILSMHTVAILGTLISASCKKQQNLFKILMMKMLPLQRISPQLSQQIPYFKGGA